jgi:hypothetical protein
MDRPQVRENIRKAMRSYVAFLQLCGEVEFGIFGGFFDIITQGMVQKVQTALQPENLEAFREEHKNDRYSIDDILMGAASGASDEEIASDDWIDAVIAEIQENFKGCAYEDDNGNIQIYEGGN